jgi:hypothetical protein
MSLNGTPFTIIGVTPRGFSGIDVGRSPDVYVPMTMQREVMPWARVTLGRLKGGPDRLTCETCHGAEADTYDWAMPAVSKLPRLDLRDGGWELYNHGLDAQMRNAFYGYAADSDRQPRAAYMREVVVPGIARLLHREPYDFTRSYEYNRGRHTVGCYHCHRV